MYCKNCGVEFENDKNECPECGTVNVFSEENDMNFDTNVSRRDKLDEIKVRREVKRKKEQKKRVIGVVILIAAIISSAGGVLAWLSASFSDNVVVEEHMQTAVPVDSATEEPTQTPDILPSEEPTPLPTVTADPDATAAPVVDGVTPTPSMAPVGTATVAPVTTAKPVSTKKPATTSKPAAASKPAVASKPAATSKPQTSSPVTMGDAINNKYVELSEAYATENSPVDKMSFKMGNETYYANVNKGTTTGQINGRYKYITAHATSETFNGKPVYEITSMSDDKPAASTGTVSYQGEYVLANSSSEYVTDAQLGGLSKSELSIARNEIYARHGRKFNSSSLQKYFEAKSWYKVNNSYNYSDDSANLTKVEKANIQKILKAEAAR